MQLSGHEEAVKLFDQYSQSGDKPELKQFAQQTLPNLREHLQHVQQLRSQLPPDQSAQNQSGQPVAQGSAPQAAGTPTGAGAATSAAAVNFVATRPQDQFRARKLIGSRVYAANDENVGEINDVLMDQSGRVHAVILGVGGFLGIGEKDVAVPMNSLKFMAERPAARATNTTTTTTGNVANPSAPATTTAPPPANTNPNASANAPAGPRAAGTDDDGVPDYIVLSMTKEQLNSAPKFEDTRR
jgi:sporulation protein YlmC with PRC-barrel domain